MAKLVYLGVLGAFITFGLMMPTTLAESLDDNAIRRFMMDILRDELAIQARQLGRRSYGLDKINAEFLERSEEYEIDDLKTTLQKYKAQFMKFDQDQSGDIELMELKTMMETLDQAKTHLELMEMINEVDADNSGTIGYHEFLEMWLGKRSSILKLILMFEEKLGGNARPAVVPSISL